MEKINMLYGNEMILQMARTCRSIKEMEEKFRATKGQLNSCITKLGIKNDVKKLVRTYRKNNPSLNEKYSKEKLFEAASKSNTMKEMGVYFNNITRERIRQIINLLGIHDEIQDILKTNHSGISFPKSTKSGIYSIYFQNDPEKKKYYGTTINLRRAIQVSYSQMKSKSNKIKSRLIVACKKFGIENFKWEIIKECPLKSIKKEAQKLLDKNLDKNYNLKYFRSNEERKRYLYIAYKEKMLKTIKKKKSIYLGVYHHYCSHLWVARPKDITKKPRGQQKYMGYFKTEKESYEAIRNWLKTITVSCKCGKKWTPKSTMDTKCPNCNNKHTSSTI